MTLTLSITNVDHLDNGESTQLRLDRHGAVIGRSPHSDWSLPDPKNYVSSTHCEIDYRDGAYLLIDKSTNGTFINGAEQRMSGSHVLRDGDIIGIGQYRVAVSGGGARAGAAPTAAAPPPPPAAGAPSAGWAGWNANPAAAGAPAPPPTPSAGWESAPSGWDRKPQPGAGSGWGADVAPDQTPEAGWATPTPAAGAGGPSGWGAADARATSDWNAVDEGSAPSGGGWSAPPAPTPSDPAARGSGGWQAPSGPGPSPSDSRSGFGVAAAAPYTPPAADGGAWGKAGAGPAKPAASGWDAIAPARDDTPVAESRFGGASITGRGAMSQNWAPPRVDNPAPPPAAPGSVDVWGAMAASNTVDWGRGGFGDPEPAPAAAPVPPAAAAAPGPDAQAWRALLAAAGVPPEGLSAPPEQAAATAGALLKRLVSGLVVMMEARARAKAQLGAQSTTLELKGNNPIKFARSPERVLAQLLNPPERGFMGATDAVEDSFRDLQAHQMATLAAMQGALRATLDRFSPEAIRSRAEMRGVLARILPGARNATLWEAYEREFEGVAKGSDEAFMDVFAKAFKAAYEATSAQMKAQGGG